MAVHVVPSKRSLAVTYGVVLLNPVIAYMFEPTTAAPKNDRAFAMDGSICHVPGVHTSVSCGPNGASPGEPAAPLESTGTDPCAPEETTPAADALSSAPLESVAGTETPIARRRRMVTDQRILVIGRFM